MATYSVNLTAGKVNFTVAKYNYICRNEKYGENKSRKEELQFFASGNMPSWAAKEPFLFWQLADQNEKANPFREFKIALPEELSLEQNIELVEKFIQNNLPKQPYTYAIHSKPAKLDEAHTNIHVHLMFSDRMIEEDRNISIEDFFKRHSQKKDGTIVGGAKKNRKIGGSERTEWLRECRKNWAELVNEAYRENGIDKKIDHRTLEEIKKEKEKDGELIEANYYDRKPRKRLGRKIIQSSAFINGKSDNPEIDEKIKEYQSTIEEKEKKKKEKEHFKNTKNIYGIHVKEFAAKEESEIRKRTEILETENKKLWKQIVHQNGMDTIAKNKLTNQKYGRLKKKLKQLQSKKNWLIDQEQKEDVVVVTQEIKRTQKELDEINKVIDKNKESYSKIIQEIIGQNDEIKKQIWKNNAMIRRLKNKLNQITKDNAEIYKIENDSLLHRAGAKRISGVSVGQKKRREEDIIDKILNSNQDLQQIHIATQDDENRNKESEIGI